MSLISPPNSPSTEIRTRRDISPERGLFAQRQFPFDSPNTRKTASSLPFTKRQKFTNLSEEGHESLVAKPDIEHLTPSGSSLRSNQTPTNQKVETSFRAFLSSFPDEEAATKSDVCRKMPPPMKKGSQARMTLAERMERLRRSDIEQEKLTFIQAAYNAAKSIGILQCVGSGTFSDVYVEPATATVKKVFKEYSSTSSTLLPLQGTTRLYDLAIACEKQYFLIRDAYNRGRFPIDALPILNLDQWRKEGFISQPFATKMFQPSWDAFVAKVNACGKNAQISNEEEQLLQTIQDVFKQSTEIGLCIDFKPDNLGYVNLLEFPGQERVAIIDTFGLSGSDSLDIIPMNRANIKEFSKGNPIIQAFLAQAVDSSANAQQSISL